MDTIKLTVDSTYVLDLKDDITMNFTKDLYQFIDGDPVKAFYVGMNIREWFDILNPRQRYLYSKQLRHNKDSLYKYKEQIEFWADEFSGKGETDLVYLSECILNNMFWDEESEELDRVKIAIFFGQNIKLQMNKENGEALE